MLCISAPQVRTVIPRRSTLPGDRGVLIVCDATHKTKRGFFFLLQARLPCLSHIPAVTQVL